MVFPLDMEYRTIRMVTSIWDTLFEDFDKEWESWSNRVSLYTKVSLPITGSLDLVLWIVRLEKAILAIFLMENTMDMEN